MSVHTTYKFVDDSDSESSNSTISQRTAPLRKQPQPPLLATEISMMEEHTSRGANAANNSAATNVPSSPHAKQENLSPKLSTPKALTTMELLERDRNAVAYSKSLLQEGDTLVFIAYPSNTQVFDHTGFLLTNETPFQVHSQKLLATGSKKFEELLAEWPQSKFKRRKGFARGLPPGIKYVLDLTPPDEGDEAVELISDLSCSPGIRHWYSAEKRCKVSVEVCGGKDEVAKPVKREPVYKNYLDLMDVLADDAEPETNLVNEMANYEIEVDEIIDMNRPPCPAPVSSHTLKQVEVQQFEEQQLQEALQRSKMDSYNHHPTTPAKFKDSYQSVDEVPEYCPIRHRAGIERLLQLIEGKEPRLDSAPKVWTLFVLAKYFDCTNVVVDFIVSWVLREPNCQFVEILPEATLRMGLGLKSAMLTRPAFAILVSEHALSNISRECGSFAADKAGTNQFGRQRENIDEDTVSAVQEAANSFINRIQSVMAELCDAHMAWLAKLPEIQKIQKIVNWAKNSSIGEEENKVLVENASFLQRSLAHLVRGRILWAFNRELPIDQDHNANDHRRVETYLKEYKSNFCNDIYSMMSEKEKMVTRYPWLSLRQLPFSTGCLSNPLFDEVGVDHGSVAKNRDIAKYHGVEQVKGLDLIKYQSRLNENVLASIQKYGFNFGRLANECFRDSNASTGNYEHFPEVGDEDDWGPPPTKYSPHITPKSSSTPKPLRFEWNQDFFQAAMPGDSEFAAEPRSSQDFKSYMQSSKEGDMLERLDAAESSAASTQGVLKLPLRPKDSEDAEAMPLLEKRPYPNIPFTFDIERSGPITAGGTGNSMINRIANIINASTAFLATEHKLADPRDKAVRLHNEFDPFASADTSLSDFRPSSPDTPTTPKKSSPPRPSTMLMTPTKPAKQSEPRVPSDYWIDSDSPFFSLELFLDQVQGQVRKVCSSLLHNGDELDFTVLTDTLLCLTDDEWKYLPLWAGGNEDGSGGVFAPMIPPAPAGAGPSGPGPAFHTGYSIPSRSSTEMDFDGTSTLGESVNTSVAVENGYSDHFDRRRVLTEDTFGSEAFSEDSEDYIGTKNLGKDYACDMESELEGNISDDSEVYVGKGKGKEVAHDDVHQSVTHTGHSEDPNGEAAGEDVWDGSDEEEAFDFGAEDDEMDGGDDNDEDETMTV